MDMDEQNVEDIDQAIHDLGERRRRAAAEASRSAYEDPILDNAMSKLTLLSMHGDQFARLAMLCLDQAGYTLLTLDKVAKLLGLPTLTESKP